MSNKSERFYIYVKSLLSKTDDKRLVGQLAEEYMKELEEEIDNDE